MDDEDDPEVWVALDSSFHAAIARASRNEVFERVVTDIREALVHQSETLNIVADRQHPSTPNTVRSSQPSRPATRRGRIAMAGTCRPLAWPSTRSSTLMGTA